MGIVTHGIEASFVRLGWRGLVATRPIAPGETILEVPERLLLTNQRMDQQLHQVLQRHPGLRPEQTLAVLLLSELSKCGTSSAKEGTIETAAVGSLWQPYLMQLPKAYTTLCNWSAADINELQMDHAIEVGHSRVSRSRT